MPKSRQSREVWNQTRLRVLARDEYACVRCSVPVAEETAHVDHIRSGKLGTNAMENLRTLCRVCHVLRSDGRHRGMVANALKEGIIPPDWRPLTWDN